MHNYQEELIREKAYALWEKNGRPIGRSDEFWYKASKEVKQASPVLHLPDEEDDALIDPKLIDVITEPEPIKPKVESKDYSSIIPIILIALFFLIFIGWIVFSKLF